MRNSIIMPATISAFFLARALLLGEAFVPSSLSPAIIKAAPEVVFATEKSDVPVRSGEGGLTRSPFSSKLWPRISDTMNRMEKELSDLSPFTSLREGVFGVPSPFVSIGASIDILEGDKEWIVKVDLPGVDKKEIKLSIDDDARILDIHAERRRERDETGKEGMYHIMERGYGSVRRSFKIPETADESTIKADNKDGVLTITMQKKAETGVKKDRVINIQ